MRMNLEEQKTLEEINQKLERIDKKLDKLEEHIDFIESVYKELRNPINVYYDYKIKSNLPSVLNIL